MVLCNDNCKPCCDFCVHVEHDFIQVETGQYIKGGPVGCFAHPDKVHQEIAYNCGYCEDFHCYNASKDVL